MKKYKDISPVQSQKIMGNYILFGFDPSIFHSFCNIGAVPKVWIRAGRKAGIKEIKGALVYDHSPLKFSEVESVYSADLPTELADQVRDDSMPLYLRNINRSQRTKADRFVTWADHNSRLELMIHWYYRLLKDNNIDTIVFDNVPHGGSTIALFYLAKRMRLNIIMCYQSLFESFFIVQDYEDIGLFETSIAGDVNPNLQLNDNPLKPHKTVQLYMSQIDGRLNSHKKLLWKCLEYVYANLSYPFATKDKRRVKRREIAVTLARLKMLNLQNRHSQKADISKPFVYYPLHFQPELTIDGLGGKYADQILAAEELRRKLPDDVFIYIKENPKQTFYAREPSFFKRLEAIPNTIYVDPATNTFELTKNSLAVATQTGTVGWEALQIGKPVISFGCGWYRSLPGVFRWNEKFKWDDVVTYKFDKKSFVSAVKNLSRYFRPGLSMVKGYSKSVDDFNLEANAELVVRQIIEFAETKKNNNKTS